MPSLDFGEFATWFNAVLFAAAAAVLWAAGTRLTGYLDEITDITGMDKGFAGMLFLGGATSLPEIAAVSTAAWTGNAPLATNNLLGSVSINVMLLAAADAVLGRDALTSIVPSAATILQGTLGIVILMVLAVGVIVGDVSVLATGVWPLLLVVLCVAAFWQASRYADRAPWTIRPRSRNRPVRHDSEEEPNGGGDHSFRGLIARAVAGAAVICAAGFVLSQTADAIARSTGLGAGLVGLVLVGFATSLPELSSITAAIRRRQYEMALGDVFGTNLLTIGLIFWVDLIYAGEPVLNEAGPFEAVGALLGAIVTGMFVIGLLERQNKTFLRMGYDAVAGLVVFAAGMVLLYYVQS